MNIFVARKIKEANKRKLRERLPNRGELEYSALKYSLIGALLCLTFIGIPIGFR
ncbi:hypothetical protein [Melghirimyces algeriensis]|uniref:hypothetical protein n=1 Tax=Melghirimyces algeriensis TaxID=910412 RepID=UPI00163D47EB|nr:hypothetical protein [Melghirimyces algeriensis]